MADWNQVVLDDLTTMSQKFEQGATDYKAAVDAAKADPVDTGDGTLTEYLKYVTGVIEDLTERSQELLKEHAERVKYAHDSYERRDIENSEDLYEDMDDYKH